MIKEKVFLGNREDYKKIKIFGRVSAGRTMDV